jgi:apolipoprotein N-acyltransferase
MVDRSVGAPIARAGGPAMRAGLMAVRLNGWLDRLSPWRARGVAFLLGAFAVLALPPVHAVPVLAVSIAGLVLLIDRAPHARGAAVTGWCFGFGYFCAGLYWLANALLAVAPAFGWLLPFAIAGAVGGLSALMALFPAVAIGMARALWTRGPARIIVLAALWTFGEWLRAWVITGFPWNLIGYSWAFSDAMNQFAALAGIWGLSLVTVAVAGLPALLADWTGGRAAAGEARRWRPLAALAAAGIGLVLLLAIGVGGAVRLAGADAGRVEGVRLRLVQGDFDPATKGNADTAADMLTRHLRLSADPAGRERVTDVIWSETANPFPLERFPDVRAALGSVAPAGGLVITGVLRTDPPTGRPRQVWNSLAAVDRDGKVVATYDKSHLVPFGEYVPLHRLLPFISKFTPGIMDFSAGPGRQTLRLPGLPPVGPLICYEVIFPGEVVDRSDRPQWLLNLTNDGWYGISAGPYQHFAMARLRAVEEGLPLVRAANTGISGVVDAYGRVLARTQLGAVAVLDVDLPRPAPGLTTYARFGNATLGVLLALAALVGVALRRFAA